MKLKRKGFRAAEEVAKKLEALKLQVFDRPLGEDGQPLEPTLPQDLTQIEDATLGWLYTSFSRMVQYSSSHLGRLNSELTTKKRSFRILLAEATLAYDDKPRLLKSHLTLDPTLRALEDEMGVLVATIKLVEGMHEGYIAGKEACSRDQSRRAHLLESKQSQR